ncbi:MAG: hypothetical protein HFJ09_15130 [Lachnospiraceae bacterium]|nr:hypothetical protein [Lachnospiraceae bacterium]
MDRNCRLETVTKRVVVNRQLCIAKAFEQILEERTPRFHKYVRHIYDTYGMDFLDCSLSV